MRNLLARPTLLAARAFTRSWIWIALPFALLYLVLLAAQLGPLIGQTYNNADAASAPVIGQLFGSVHPQQVGLGQLPWYSTLIYELATRGLPLHRQLWEVTPYALALATVILIGWSVWQIAGRWAASITVTLLICASPTAIALLSSLNDHSPTWFSLALLGGFLVFVEQWRERLWLGWTAVLTLLLGVVVGMNAASDSLLFAAGLAPLLIAAIGSWLLGPSAATRRAAIACVALVIVSGLSAWATVSAMHSANVIAFQNVHFASTAQMVRNGDLWWQALGTLGNGDFFGAEITFTSLLAAACAVLTIFAVFYAVRSAYKRVKCGRAPDPATGASTAHVLYWGSSALLLTGTYVFSSAPVDLSSSRYLLGLLYAAAAVVPLLGLRNVAARAAVVAGTVVFALAGVIGATKEVATHNTSNLPTAHVAMEIAVLARRLHLDRGYAGYWDAAPITWNSDFRIHVYPVFSCGSNRLCPAPLHFISSWYQPHEGKSFLLADPTQPFVPTAPAYLGKPAAAYSIGQVTMFVYPYDISGQLHP